MVVKSGKTPRRCRECGRGGRPITKATVAPRKRPACGLDGRRERDQLCRSCDFKTRIGPGNSNWKGGITPANRKVRASPEYAEWRKAVFERDAYTCQHCGQVGNEIHADHIKPFSTHPELRLDLNNGRTLCRACHMKTPSYLGGARKLQRLERIARRQLSLF